METSLRASVLRNAFAGLGLALGAWLAAAQPGPIKVGLIAPLSGGGAEYGQNVRLGAELAVKEINEVGGYLGRPLALVVRDDKGQPDEGRKVAEELLLQEKVDFTVGFCNTGVAARAMDLFQQHKHLLMIPCASGTALMAKYPPAQSHVFRVAVPENLNARFLINEIVERRRLRRVAILADQTGYGDGGLKDLSAELAQRGLEPVYVGRFPIGAPSLMAELKAARQAGADALVVYAVGPEHGVAAQGRADMGWNVPYFAPWPLAARSLLDTVGPKALEGTMMSQTVIQDTANERRSSFMARYARHAGARIGSLMAAAQSYDAVHLMMRALMQARGDTSGPALKRALEDLQRPYQGVVTVYSKPFSAQDHDALSLNMMWLGVWRGGEVQFHDAEDAKRSSYVRRKSGT